MSYVQDNYDRFVMHESEHERWLESRPVCCNCREHIQEERAFHWNDEWLCEECVEMNMQYID